MSGIMVRSAFGKLQDILFSKDLRKEQYVTGQKSGASRRSLDTLALAVYLVGDDIVEAGSTNNLVKLTGHLARAGDFLQITSSVNGIQEFEVSIDEVVDVDHIRLGCILSGSLEAGDTVSILRVITPRMGATGATLATLDPAAINFKLDGVLQEVIEDTVTPANNRPLPVKLTNVTGDLNITAQDLNIQSSHVGANPDSMRLGDGVTEWGIEAVTKKGLVKDDTAIAALGSLLTELQLKADLLETQPVSAASLPLPTGAATEATLAAVSGKLPATLGQKVAATSLAVVLASDQPALPVTGTFFQATQPVSATSLPLPTGAATAANQTTEIGHLSTIATKDFATQTTLALMKTALDSVLTGEGAITDAAVANPASSGSMIALLKGVLTLITSTNTKLDTLDTNTSEKTATYQEILTLTTTAQTFTAPVGAAWCKIMVDDTNTANIRVKIGGVATVSSGMQFQPGRSEDYQAVGDISVIAESGTNQKISVQFGA